VSQQTVRAGNYQWNFARVLPLVAVAMLFASGAIQGGEQDTVYDSAVVFYKNEKWKDAVSEYRKFLTNWPNDKRATNARLYLGLSEVNIGDYRSARQNLRRFVELSPESKNLNHALYRIAECSYLLDELKAAREEMQAFLGRYPKDPYGERGYPYLADVEMRLGNFEQAAKLFQESLDQFPKGELADDSRFGLARSFEGLDRYEDAAKAYEQLAANLQGGRAAEALLNLGTLRYDEGKYDDAVAAFTKLETEFPKSDLLPLAKLNLGFSYYRLNKFEDAVVQFAAIATDKTQKVPAGFWKGMALKNLDRLPEAIETFTKTIDLDPNDPLVESLLFQWGDCEKRRQNYAEAMKQFQEVLVRYSDGELADDALHLSAVCALEQEDLDKTKELIEKFAKAFPQSKFQWSQELLRGRVALLEKNSEEARTQFRKVLSESNSEITKGWSRYYIAYSYYQDKDYRQALQVSDPLALSLKDLPAERQNDLAGVVVLQGACLLELAKSNNDAAERKKQLDQVEASAAKYLEMLPQGAQAPRAWGLRALAAAHSGDGERLTQILTTLKEKVPTQGADLEEIGRTLHEIAEVAFSNKNYAMSSELFRKLVEMKPTDDLYVKGLHGWGWSEYNNGRYENAAIHFQTLVEAYPDHNLAADGAFMLAKCRQEEKKLEEAITGYDQVLKKYGKSEFAFSAALQKARLLGGSDRLAEANQAFATAYNQFPEESNRDGLLDEWALLNYRQKNFAEADRIFAKLVQDYPNSLLADNARLSLAESALVALDLSGTPDSETLKKLDDVQAEFRKLAEDLNSDSDVKQTAFSQLMGIGVAKKDWSDVTRIATRIESDFPQSKYFVAALYRRGEAALNLKEYGEAEKSMRKLLEGQQQAELEKQMWYPQVPLVLAESLLQQKKYEDVKAVTEEWRAKFSDFETRDGLDEIEGRSLVNQGKFSEAREAFGRVLANPGEERTEVEARSQFMIAETYLAEQKYESAEKEYILVELYQYPVWQARAAYQQGACLEALKQIDKAVERYEVLLQKWPDSEQAAMARSRLEALGKKVESTSGQ